MLCSKSVSDSDEQKVWWIARIRRRLIYNIPIDIRDNNDIGPWDGDGPTQLLMAMEQCFY